MLKSEHFVIFKSYSRHTFYWVVYTQLVKRLKKSQINQQVNKRENFCHYDLIIILVNSYHLLWFTRWHGNEHRDTYTFFMIQNRLIFKILSIYFNIYVDLRFVLIVVIATTFFNIFYLLINILRCVFCDTLWFILCQVILDIVYVEHRVA